MTIDKVFDLEKIEDISEEDKKEIYEITRDLIDSKEYEGRIKGKTIPEIHEEIYENQFKKQYKE